MYTFEDLKQALKEGSISVNEYQDMWYQLAQKTKQ